MALRRFCRNCFFFFFFFLFFLLFFFSSRRQVRAITWVRSRPDTRRHIWMFITVLPAVFRCCSKLPLLRFNVSDSCTLLSVISILHIRTSWFKLLSEFIQNRYLLHLNLKYLEKINLYFLNVCVKWQRIKNKRLKFLFMQMRITCWRSLCRTQRRYSRAKIIRLYERVFVL